MMMSRGIIAGIVGVFAALTMSACSQSPVSSGPTSASTTAELPAGMKLTANGDEIVWCAISPPYQGMYWVVVVGDPTGGPCGAGEVITQEQFDAIGATEVCEVTLPDGGTATYYANSAARARNLAQGACVAS